MATNSEVRGDGLGGRAREGRKTSSAGAKC